ncbi:glycerate kinase type-2 family protein [Haloarcula amylovorans]|uniref:glycerate kinase type-2 family protein n=1 Tax=Haloarcula amylovorans TaxID=2562280 RepID=UPI001076156E|nr:DUF4147 domain-containing protein [Halomicroarcula amylolytica]
MFQSARDRWETREQRLVLDCLAAGIERARPTNIIDQKITLDSRILQIESSQYDLEEYDNIYVIGGGNAAGHIAAELTAVLDDIITDGIVVTDDIEQADPVEVLQGSHPVPSPEGVEHTRQMRHLASKAGENDLVLAIIAGGGSALLTAPRADISLEDIQETTSELLHSGASIDQINAVRKHLSEIKGGQLARDAAPSTIVGLIFSDVIGDDLSTIASGPIAPDKTTFRSALNVIDSHKVTVPDSVRQLLERGARGEIDETPNTSHRVFENTTNHVLATGYDALEGAAEQATANGVEAHILSSRIRGEAAEAALTHAAISEEILETGNPVEPPVVIISGGETTVTVQGDGQGGPNQEFALSAALEVPTDVVLASVDSDGIDGATDAAGALVDGKTVIDEELGRQALANNDAYGFLAEHDDLLFTGPTGTNVNDLRVIVVGDI